MPMPRKALADDFALQDFQRGEECRCPMSYIIMSERAGTPFLERQTRLRAVQGLNLDLLIDTQNQAPVGWV